jgi:hypothetical protein
MNAFYRQLRRLEAEGARLIAYLGTPPQPEDPSTTFLRLLAGGLAAGRFHVASHVGCPPFCDPSEWGWRGSGDSWEPLGPRIGWLKRCDLYLSEAAYTAAKELARERGISLPVSMQTLRKRLNAHDQLASTDPTRQVLTVRRVIEGRRVNVLHLRRSALWALQPIQSAESV